MGTAIEPERQSAQMSKITNDSLTRCGTGCYTARVVPICNSGRQRVKLWPPAVRF